MLHVLLALLAVLASGSAQEQVDAGFDAKITLQGTIPLDINGNQVHAHGGQLLQEGSTFYWVGTSQKQLPFWVSEEIVLYSSADLVTWEFRNVLLNWRQIKGFPDILPYGRITVRPPPYRIERPKLLRHPSGRYILMFHLDSPGFDVPAVGVATAPSITGLPPAVCYTPCCNKQPSPYTYVHHLWPDNDTSYDMTVHQHGSEAYLVRSCPVMRIAVSRLREDWLDTEGLVCSQTNIGAEAPAVFRHAGVHYIFASHLTGWDPNPPLLHQSTAADGGMCSTFWRELPQPTHGPQAGTTFDSQSTFVLTLHFSDGTPLQLWMGDRWNPKGPGSVGNASYVWLPLLPRVGAPGFELVWAQNWGLQQYKGAVWDAAAQHVKFATPGAAPAVAKDSVPDVAFS